MMRNFHQVSGKGRSIQFLAFERYLVGTLPFVMAVGDLNGDGKLDIAVVNNGSATVNILLGRGDGNFDPVVD